MMAAAFNLAGCAPHSAVPNVSKEAIESEAARQLAFRFENLLQEIQRVQNVSYRVLTANVDQCKKVGSKFGASFHSLDQLPKEIHPIARERLGLDRRVSIVNIVPGSPAEKAGLLRGDAILRVSGTAVPVGHRGSNKLGKLLRRSKLDKSIRIVVSRGGNRLNVSVRPVRACDYPVFMAGKNETNAFTDGRRIVLQRGIVKLASTDEELALVVAHELAHITAGHLQKKTANKVAGTFGGLALDLAAAAAGVDTRGAFTRAGGNIGAQAYSQDFEKEANYIGMYFVAGSGFDTKGVERFWRKMADSNPASISFAGTHPTSAERFLVISKTNKEIAAKRRGKRPLQPNQIARR